LCLAGVAVSAELTRIHVKVHTDPNYHSVCAMSEGVNCETVAVSPFSVFAGLPVSVWGLAGYLVMGALATWSLTRRRLHARWPLGLLLVLTGFSVVVSAALAFISATRIDSLCLFCTASYVLNAALLVTTTLAWRRTGLRVKTLVADDVNALRAVPGTFAALTGLALTGLLALQVLVPPYWTTPGWKDLPRLPTGTDGAGHHWVGAVHPRITVVEFSDYECPHCRSAHKATRLLAAAHPETVRLVHRHLPLDMACHPALRRPFHLRACLFAQAAACAALQGRFWEMNDALFATQDIVKTVSVDPVDLAVRLGLDRLTFKRCLESNATAETIDADVREAMSQGITGTPTFLVAGKKFAGRIPEAEWERLIAEAP
jgi:protein-disulfide isomerase/uncharacterized membrane protein